MIHQNEVRKWKATTFFSPLLILILILITLISVPLVIIKLLYTVGMPKESLQRACIDLSLPEFLAKAHVLAN